jgi:hypothetical protein
MTVSLMAVVEKIDDENDTAPSLAEQRRTLNHNAGNTAVACTIPSLRDRQQQYIAHRRSQTQVRDSRLVL